MDTPRLLIQLVPLYNNIIQMLEANNEFKVNYNLLVLPSSEIELLHHLDQQDNYLLNLFQLMTVSLKAKDRIK